MGFWETVISKFKTPDAILPVTTNLNNYLYSDPFGAVGDVFQDVTKFIATEFTKVKITTTETIPNRERLGYLLNVKPNPDQSANELLYEFAYGMLAHGRVYYKIEQPANSAVSAIYINRAQLDNSYKVFTARHLKLNDTSELQEKYTDLLNTISTRRATGALEINSKLAGTITPEQQNEAMNNRLQTAQEQINKFGAFFTVQNESSKDHVNLTQPDRTALQDMKAIIYESLHINQALLTGDYNEVQYRAFNTTYITPLSASLSELLNIEVVGYNNYIAGERIEVILDLLQFSSLADLTAFADKGIYSGWIRYDEIRKVIGKDAYGGDIGSYIFSNKNAVILNDDTANKALETKENGGN